MTGLVAFLTARLDEDHERAEFVRRQNEGPWHAPFEPWRLTWHDEYDLLCIEPSRALAEVEAKRAIVEWAQTCEEKDVHVDAWTLSKIVIRQLATVYADHPDYRDEWRPPSGVASTP